MKPLHIAAVALLSLSAPAGADTRKENSEKAKPAEAAADHEHDHGHTAKAGPTGGRLITSVEPHVEFFVNDQNRVEIRFVDEDDKVIAPKDQVISVTMGDRRKPTRLTFRKDGDRLVSDKAVPEGNNHPVVLQIKSDAKAKAVIERFNLNRTKCPECDYAEYACVCDHDHDADSHGDHKDHDHREGGKK